MDYTKILNYLYSLESPRIKLGLERVQKLLDKIENPEKKLKCIHVAGTNGKGSVCAMIFYILREAGFKVGLYTSPHFKKFNERIRINDHFISDKEIVDYFLKVKPFITSQSFFEITTAMAFLYFYEKNVDYAVLEVGLGGRLDATNVVNPLVSVITNIGLEHTEILGNKIEKIAFEKAGIIKKNIPIVTGAKGKALKVIKKIAEERNAQLVIAKKYPNIEFKYLNGTFQQQNKDIALATINTLKKYHSLENQRFSGHQKRKAFFSAIKINENQIKNGIEKTKWPGRLQFISKNLLIDAAHNPDCFRVLYNELKLIKKNRKIKNFVFVVGIQKDKNIRDMLKTINPLISAIIFTKSKNPKAEEPQHLLSIFNKINKNKNINQKIIKKPKKALKYAKKIAEEKDLVVATGSIYMLGDAI